MCTDIKNRQMHNFERIILAKENLWFMLLLDCEGRGISLKIRHRLRLSLWRRINCLS